MVRWLLVVGRGGACVMGVCMDRCLCSRPMEDDDGPNTNPFPPQKNNYYR